MLTRKTIWFAFVFFLSMTIIALPLSHAALPKYYNGMKRAVKGVTLQKEL